MMELKVWVDGIQRVVCGVTMETTCQDVVIALAHAMGRTGRFTLIEKWREVERPLTADENPLKVLHKWGEYAAEVRLFLCQSDSVKFQSSHDRHKQPSRPTFNISPPKSHSENTVKRNLTFSGAHSPGFSLSTAVLRHGGVLENCVSPHSPYHSSTSSAQSSPRPVPAPRHSPGPRHSPAPRLSPASAHSPSVTTSPLVNGVKVLPSRSSHDVSQVIQFPLASDDHHKGKSLSPNSSTSTSYRPTSPSIHRYHSPSPNTIGFNSFKTIPAEEHSLDNPRHPQQTCSDTEEYDLDTNFPDVLRDSKQTERPSVHMEYRFEEKSDNKPEPERARLLHLVSMQKERLNVQQSQLDVVETEIISLEDKEKEYEHDLHLLTDDLVQLEQRDHDDEVEMTEISAVPWLDVLEKEQKTERKLKAELAELRDRLSELEVELASKWKQVSELEKEVESAKKEVKEKESLAALKRQQEVERCTEEEAKVREELSAARSGEEVRVKEVEQVMAEIAQLEKSVAERHREFADLEADLKQVNLKEFGSTSLSPTHGKPADSGEAVLKILEGRLSPRPPTTPTTPNQQAFINSLASKNPNGVWV